MTKNISFLMGLVVLGTLVGQVSHAENVSGCKASDFVLVDQAAVSIKTGPGGYSPKCLQVRAGTLVTIAGSGMHPLQAQADKGGVKNPFGTAGGSTSSVTQTLKQPGTYGYYCINHGNPDGTGMAGAIQVIQ